VEEATVADTAALQEGRGGEKVLIVDNMRCSQVLSMFYVGGLMPVGVQPRVKAKAELTYWDSEKFEAGFNGAAMKWTRKHTIILWELATVYTYSSYMGHER
jgi:hypothetical protein